MNDTCHRFLEKWDPWDPQWDPPPFSSPEALSKWWYVMTRYNYIQGEIYSGRMETTAEKRMEMLLPSLSSKIWKKLVSKDKNGKYSHHYPQAASAHKTSNGFLISGFASPNVKAQHDGPPPMQSMEQHPVQWAW